MSDYSRTAMASGVLQRGTVVVLAVVMASAVVLAAFVLTAASPAAADDPSVTLTAAIDGKSLARTSGSSPVKLSADRPVVLTLTVVNGGTAPLDIRKIRVDGSVMGLTFFAYNTAVALRVAPGASEDRSFTLDLADLKGQATGLMPASLSLVDAEGDTVATRGFTADVRGSLRSAYGLFGFTALLLTAVALAGTFLALARGRLTPNRAMRGVRFAVGGLGLGVSAVFLLSAIRVVAPTASRWIPILGVCVVVFFVLGYLTPTPDTGEEVPAWDGVMPPSGTVDDPLRTTVTTGRETINRQFPPT